jgi:hypothetical protein
MSVFKLLISSRLEDGDAEMDVVKPVAEDIPFFDDVVAGDQRRRRKTGRMGCVCGRL